MEHECEQRRCTQYACLPQFLAVPLAYSFCDAHYTVSIAYLPDTPSPVLIRALCLV